MVPLYQRRYSWTRLEWEPFWNAVYRQYELLSEGDTGERPAHFFGSLVLQPQGDQASGLSSYGVIDGQQRLTSVFVLLSVLRDQWPDEEHSERLMESYLINKWEKGATRYKLRPGWHDQHDLASIIDGNPAAASGPIGSAYKWLRNALAVAKEREAVDYDALERAITGRLEVVDITTDTGDNVHRIFQTLNSTGRRLSQVDLLRNHFFMLLPTRAEEAYENLWSPMESDLKDWLDFFLWVDLVTRGGGRESISREQVYRQWQDDLEPVEHVEEEVYRALEALTRRAQSYAKLLYPERIADAKLRATLETLGQWGATVHHPVILKALVLLDQGTLATEAVGTAVSYVESFLVRRLLTRIPTNNLNRIFTTTVAQVPSTAAFPDDLRKSLSSAGKYWPTDAELRAAIQTEPFYWAQRPAQRQYVLRRLEEAIPGKEKPDWTACHYTAEHIMPQHLSPEWHAALADSGELDPVAAHVSLVHTLGNMTLTCDNSELSDSPMKRKKEIYNNSMLRMNNTLASTPTWARTEIHARGEYLAGIAVQRWPAPIPVVAKPNEASLQLVADALNRLPESRWTSLEELADAANTSVGSVREFVISKGSLAGRGTILLPDGTFDTSLPWVVKDLAAYKTGLVSLGILEDANDKAAPMSKRLTGEDLAGLLGDA